MKKQETTLKRTDTITITGRDVNEAGIYTSCSLLQEVIRANDLTVATAFNTTAIAQVHAIRYNIDFLAAAAAGDTLGIQTSYIFTAANELQVRIEVSKMNRQRPIAICAGNFTFVNTGNTAKTLSYHADTILA